uniref:Uncharacterized protein n=1 Tax=Anguilla anguilla TaxID=7936 RepID=A0A0E9SIW2_ANGAN
MSLYSFQGQRAIGPDYSIAVQKTSIYSQSLARESIPQLSMGAS